MATTVAQIEELLLTKSRLKEMIDKQKSDSSMQNMLNSLLEGATREVPDGLKIMNSVFGKMNESKTEILNEALAKVDEQLALFEAKINQEA